MSESPKLYTPVYIVQGKRFIFAYQDQVFVTESEAKARGYHLGKELEQIESGARFSGKVVNVLKMKPETDVIDVPIKEWKIIFLKDEVKKKRERSRRKKGSV